MVIGLEALAGLAFGVVEVSQTRASRLVVGSGVALLMLGYAGFLAAVSLGVARGRPWSRGAGVATQLLQLLLGYSFRQGQTWPVALVLGSTAVLTLVCLLVPSATAVFVGSDPSDRD